ncbi:hypothetical protein LXA43DRAFT_1062876 [Ganoderma leucocontextum]|nr:hypothetical protein LXA43DRAFT_1062876 [Ganoderma leucocontextum]
MSIPELVSRLEEIASAVMRNPPHLQQLRVQDNRLTLTASTDVAAFVLRYREGDWRGRRDLGCICVFHEVSNALIFVAPRHQFVKPPKTIREIPEDPSWSTSWISRSSRHSVRRRVEMCGSIRKGLKCEALFGIVLRKRCIVMRDAELIRLCVNILRMWGARREAHHMGQGPPQQTRGGDGEGEIRLESLLTRGVDGGRSGAAFIGGGGAGMGK